MKCKNIVRSVVLLFLSAALVPSGAWAAEEMSIWGI